MAAVIAFAAINPGMGSADSSTANARPAPAQAEGGMALAPNVDAAGASQLAWGVCGTSPFNAEVPAVSDKFSLALGDIGAEAKQGSTIDAPVTVHSPGDFIGSYNWNAPQYMVLWNGTVVGTAQGSTTSQTTSTMGSLPHDRGTSRPRELLGRHPPPSRQLQAGGIPRLLPRVHATRAYDRAVAVTVGVAVDPAPLPVDPAPLPVDPKPIPVDPTLAPVDPAPAPIEPTASPDRPITTDGSAVAGGAVAGNTGVVGPAADGPAERAVSNTVKLVIAGDVPKDPFGAYLSPAAPAVVYPDDYLTPATARDEYTSRATTGTWDMAAGSQRVVKTGDSLTQNDQNAWLNSYYGCSADGKSLPSFPAASADWSLLKVDATLPGSVGVSYGWVVDGNPVVKVSVKNVSSYTLPGFWGQPNTTMYLVKDGKVVASSYLAPTDPNSNSVTRSSDGLLAPDASLSGTYLWRDVNGCWLGSQQATLKPGTYTVLMEQDISLNDSTAGPGGPIAYVDGKRAVEGGVTGVGIAGGGAAGGSAVDQGPVPAPAPAPAPATGPPTVATAPSSAPDAPNLIAPAPGEAGNDWLSLQVWTSLGKVTVR